MSAPTETAQSLRTQIAALSIAADPTLAATWDELIDERDRARATAVALEQDHARLLRDLRAVADDLDESGQKYAALRITRALAGAL